MTSSLFATRSGSSGPAVVVLCEGRQHLPWKCWHGPQAHGDRCRWRLEGSHGGAASISTGKLAQRMLLTWGHPAQQCAGSGQVQVSRLCTVPVAVLLDVKIIWHVFKGEKMTKAKLFLQLKDMRGDTFITIGVILNKS